MQLREGHKIYLLGGDMFYMNIFQQHLVNLGYTDVSIFSDPMACFDKLTPPPDIIFYDNGLDFSMGLNVLKIIKGHSPDIYMIFICDEEEVDVVIQSLKYGAFDYFVRGVDEAKNIELLLNKIQSIKELLQSNNIIRLKKFHSADSKKIDPV